MAKKGDGPQQPKRRRPRPAGPAGSDQRHGEEVVQVNDAYQGGGPPPENPTQHEQHATPG